MSVSNPITVPCPRCGAPQELRLFVSMNADRMPHLREQVLSGDAQAFTCTACGARGRVPPQMTWFDMELGLWMRVLPHALRHLWEEHEVDTQLVWLKSFGPMGSPVAQQIGADMRARMVFGWHGLREKLLCAQAGIPDDTLELLKLAAMGLGVATAPGERADLRLVEVQEDTLVFARLSNGDERVLEVITGPRALLAEIDAAPEAWAPLRQAVTGLGFFVDLQRTLLEEVEGRADAA